MQQRNQQCHDDGGVDAAAGCKAAATINAWATRQCAGCPLQRSRDISNIGVPLPAFNSRLELNFKMLEKSLNFFYSNQALNIRN